MARQRLLVKIACCLIAVAGFATTSSAQPASGPFNVRLAPYSAFGDGTHDDTAAFNAAITAVPPSGGEIYIPAGRYKLTSTLNISGKPIAFRGEGQRISQLVYVGSGVLHGIAFVTTGSDTLTVKSLSFLRACTAPNPGGSCADGIAWGAAINGTWSSAASLSTRPLSATIQDVHVGIDQPSLGMGDSVHFIAGIALNYANGAKISNFNLHGDWCNDTSAIVAIQFNGQSSNVHISDGDISAWRYGIQVQNDINDVYINDVETGAVQYGFSVGQGTGLHIANSHSFAALRGIEVTNRTDVSITNNLIFTFPCNTGAVASDSLSCAQAWAGIHSITTVSGNGRLRAIGNEVYSQDPNRPDRRYGIMVEGPLADSTVQGNVTQLMTYGILLGPYSTFPSVTNSVVAGNRSIPISGYGAPYADLGGAPANNHWVDNY